MSDETAAGIAREARARRLHLTAHAPYFVNLCGSDEIARASLERLVSTARLGARCGARSFCFHAGWYGEQSVARAGRRVRKALRDLMRRMRGEGLAIDARPELTGRPSQAGCFEEILAWSEIEGVRPCVDFAHHYARLQGRANGYDEFRGMLETVVRRLGRSALRNLHVHVTGIEYGPKGERRHVTLRESRFRWRDVMRALADARVGGWVICESPAMEDDALLLQRTWRSFA
jgi:deoxyribonuclease-4